jgi:polar amino acid transport system substrate-binding protein
MKPFFLQILLIIFFSMNSFANTLNLNKEEQLFIQNNPIIKVAMMPDFTPFSYSFEDTTIGFEHDLLEIVSQRTNLKFEKKIAKWPVIYKSFKNKEVDMITSISHKDYREEFTIFTSSYYDIPIMIFVRDDFGKYNGLDSLKGKKVGVIKDVFYINELKKLDNLDLVEYSGYEQPLNDLVFGKIDVVIQNLTNINFFIKKHLYSNIELASELILPNTKQEDLRFGVQTEKPILSSILQKALSSITQKEKDALVNKWIGSIKEYAGGHIELNDKEKSYLNNKAIKYCINPSGMPFEGFNKNAKHVGMSKDYYNLFEKILSSKFELVQTDTWSDSLSYLLEHKCDMLAFGVETPERKKLLNFTSYYLDVPLVVATRVDGPFINHILDLENKKIGLIKDDAFVKILRTKYPSLEIIEVENISDGLNKVKNEEIYAFIDTLASIGYEFQSNYFGELKIAGKISESLKLSITINKEETILLDIMQKTINKISNETHREIFAKWIPIRYEAGMDYGLILKIVLIAFLIIALIIYWNTKIIKANKLLKEAKKELNILATTDKLTDVYNRRKFEEVLSNELNRAKRFDKNFCLSILDIDDFKQINDTYGHQTGDLVLREIASVLKNNLRETDFVARYGGEEFIVIFPEADIQYISKLTQNLRLKIANHNFKDISNFTASFGLTLSNKDDNSDTILKRADIALYKAKETGKNKVVVN